MKTLALEQGSPEWHAHRATHFNASDAPAMMGCSPYKTRSQLLHELHTGFAPDVDAATQRRFDDGHRFEALARPMAEQIIGEDLYPVVGTEGELSASFDGLTMAEDIAFEHKTLNDELRACMGGPAIGGELSPHTVLPPHYRVQMEQQLLVSGAEEVIFMATRWEGDECAEMRHFRYFPDLGLRAQIVGGWKQFAADLAAYKPSATAPVVVAAPIESLPAVSVRVNGELAIDSNLPAFGTALRSFIDRIPAQPSTDQEFADTEAACKSLKKAEDALDSAETGALAQLSSVEEMRRLVADLRNLARTTRLQREKLVTQRKDQIKLEILQGAHDALKAHLAALNARVANLMPAWQADFIGAMKGKRTLASLRDAADTTLAQAKIASSEQADRIQVNLETIKAAAHAVLFPDLGALVVKSPEDLAAVIAHRIAEHDKAIQAAKDKADAAAVAAAAPAPVVAPTPAVVQMLSRAPSAPATAPTLSLGQIGTRLGFALSADFLRTIGFEPAGKQRGAVLFHEAQFGHICAALIEHVQSIQALQAA